MTRNSRTNKIGRVIARTTIYGGLIAGAFSVYSNRSDGRSMREVQVAYASPKTNGFNQRDQQIYNIWDCAYSRVTEQDETKHFADLDKQEKTNQLVSYSPHRVNDLSLENARKNGEEIQRSLEKGLYGTGEYSGKTLIKRFREFEDYFVKYSRDPPKGFTQDQFMALLVAIAEQESSLGYPNGQGRNPSVLMGYDNGGSEREKYSGVERQIKTCADTLYRALNGVNPKYKDANKYDKKLRPVLSIYRIGEVDSDGMEYAEAVMDRYDRWKKEFSKN